jgi:hypothetical protein
MDFEVTFGLRCCCCSKQSFDQQRFQAELGNEMELREIAMRSILPWAGAIVLACAVAAEAGSPNLQRIVPPGAQRGTTVEIQLQGRYLEAPEEVLLYEPGMAVEAVEMLNEGDVNGRIQRVDQGTRIRVRLAIAADCPLGLHGMRLRTAHGISDYQRFFVGPFPTIEETEIARRSRNDKPETAQPVPLNSTVLGRMIEAADIDLFRIEAKKGQRLSAEIEATRLGVERGIPDLHLAILDANGKPLMAADDSALFLQDPFVSLVAPADGIYFVAVRDATYAAANDIYRLHIGTFVRPTGLYPAGGPAGRELSVQVLGDPNGVWAQSIMLPARVHTGANFTAAGSNFDHITVDPTTGVATPTPNTLRVSPFDNVLEQEPNDSLDAVALQSAANLPIAFNGIISQAGDVDCFRFTARKGERFKVHCLANALGSPLDPTIWINRMDGKGNTHRATESRANQLGYPPYGGMNRETLDPILEFTVPDDGDYVLGVEDDRAGGGTDFVYRVEVSAETDAVYVYVPQDPESQFQPQARQAIAVPAGGRYSTQLSIVNTNKAFGEDIELIALGLPAGVTMYAPRVTPAMPRVPVVFEAAADAKLQGGFIEIIARPVDSDIAEGPERKLVSGFRQSITMNSSNNNDYYLFNIFDKLAFAVVEPAPFSIEVEEPRSALVQNGEMRLKFKITRAAGSDEPLSIAMEWKPNGMTTGTPIVCRGDQTEGEYLLGAARNATAGSYQVTLSAVTGSQRPAYRDGANRTYVSTRPFKLLVAEPHIDAKFVRTSIERGKTADVTIKLNHLKPFEGKAKATLARLPRGVELVEPFREITSADQQVIFTLRATDDCLTGGYQGMTLDIVVTEEGQAVRQLTGSGTLRIDAERGVKAALK